jgi:hypothetical protein
MLIDCERMIKVWTLKDAQGGKTHGHFRDEVHDKKLWGRLPGEWNARDDEYSADKSKCFHFTTLQTQPWQPFPDVLRYEPHPDGEVWFALERSADRASFNVFTKDRPSQRFGELLEQYKILRDGKGKFPNSPAREFVLQRSLGLHEAEIKQLIGETGAKSVLDYGAGAGTRYNPFPDEAEGSRIKSLAAWPDVRVTCYDAVNETFSAAFRGKFDGAISVDALQHISEEDIGWVLDVLFESANSFVYVAVSCIPAKHVLPNGMPMPCTVQPLEWWKGHFELAAKRNSGIRWRVRSIETPGSLKGSRHFEGQGEMAKAA